jgi:ribosomal protein S21
MRDKNGLPQGLVVEVQNVKKKEFYVKPSEIRRRARGQALARMRKRNRIDEMVNKNDKTEN